jgi:hypothetical protein
MGKKGTIYETTEAAEKNSVFSKNPPIKEIREG